MKRKPFEERIIGTLTETLAALREGKPLVVVERRPNLPPPPPFDGALVARIRTELEMTQKEFSALVSVSPKTIQSWEQGTRKPSGAARRTLQFLHSPEILNSILSRRSPGNRASSEVLAETRR